MIYKTLLRAVFFSLTFNETYGILSIEYFSGGYYGKK